MNEGIDAMWWATVVLAAIVFAFAIATVRRKMRETRRVEPKERNPVLDEDVALRERQSRKPQPGDRRYSNYFKSPIELVTYHSDAYYTFKVLDGYYKGQTLRNQATWSSLPDGPGKDS